MIIYQQPPPYPTHEVAVTEPGLEALLLPTEFIPFSAGKDLLRPQVMQQVITGVGKCAEVGIRT